MIELTTPLSEEIVSGLQVGDTVEISGYILCGRDAVLPKILEMIENDTIEDLGIDLCGHQTLHVDLVSLVDEQDTDYRHADKYHERGYEKYDVDPGPEVVPLEGHLLFIPLPEEVQHGAETEEKV